MRGEPNDQPIEFGRRERHEVGFVDFFRIRFADLRNDQLQLALEELRVAFDANVVTIFKAAVLMIAGVPHPPGDAAGPVGKVDLQVEVAVLVRPELLLRGEKRLVDLIGRPKLLNETTRHVLTTPTRRTTATLCIADQRCRQTAILGGK